MPEFSLKFKQDEETRLWTPSIQRTSQEVRPMIFIPLGGAGFDAVYYVYHMCRKIYGPYAHKLFHLVYADAIEQRFGHANYDLSDLVQNMDDLNHLLSADDYLDISLNGVIEWQQHPELRDRLPAGAVEYLSDSTRRGGQGNDQLRWVGFTALMLGLDELRRKIVDKFRSIHDPDVMKDFAKIGDPILLIAGGMGGGTCSGGVIPTGYLCKHLRKTGQIDGRTEILMCLLDPSLSNETDMARRNADYLTRELTACCRRGFTFSFPDRSETPVRGRPADRIYLLNRSNDLLNLNSKRDAAQMLAEWCVLMTDTTRYRAYGERISNYQNRNRWHDCWGNPRVFSGFSVIKIQKKTRNYLQLGASWLAHGLLLPKIMVHESELSPEQMTDKAKEFLREARLSPQTQKAVLEARNPLTSVVGDLVNRIRSRQCQPNPITESTILQSSATEAAQVLNDEARRGSGILDKHQIAALTTLKAILGQAELKYGIKNAVGIAQKIVELCKQAELEISTVRDNIRAISGKSAEEFSRCLAELTTVPSRLLGGFRREILLQYRRKIIEALQILLNHQAEFLALSQLAASYQTTVGQQNIRNGLTDRIQEEVVAPLITKLAFWEATAVALKKIALGERNDLLVQEAGYITRVDPATEATIEHFLDNLERQLKSETHLRHELAQVIEDISQQISDDATGNAQAITTGIAEILGRQADHLKSLEDLAASDREIRAAVFERMILARPFIQLDHQLLKEYGVTFEDSGFRMILTPKGDNSPLVEHTQQYGIQKIDLAVGGDEDSIVVLEEIHGIYAYGVKPLHGWTTATGLLEKNQHPSALSGAVPRELVKKIEKPDDNFRRGVSSIGLKAIGWGVASVAIHRNTYGTMAPVITVVREIYGATPILDEAGVPIPENIERREFSDLNELITFIFESEEIRNEIQAKIDVTLRKIGPEAAVKRLVLLHKALHLLEGQRTDQERLRQIIRTIVTREFRINVLAQDLSVVDEWPGELSVSEEPKPAGAPAVMTTRDGTYD